MSSRSRLGGVLVVEIERERGVVELRAHPVGAAKGAGELHLLDDFRGEDFAGLIVPGEGLQQLFVAEELFKHLRGHFDEVAFGGEAGEAGPLGLAAEDGVHQVAELVEEGDDVGVLQQAGIVGIACGEVADERGFRHGAAADAGDDGRGGEPFVLALARMHVEIEAADGPAAVEDLEDGDGRVPGGRAGRTELDFEEARGGLEDAGLDLRVGEVGADGLGVEVEGGAAELLVPVAAAGDVDARSGSGWRLRAKSRTSSMLAAGALAAGLVELGEEGADIGGRAHHLVGGGQIGPAAEAEDGGDLLAGGEQVKENLLVGRIGAGVVGEEHALARSSGLDGEGHHRLHLGRVGGEGDAALGVGLWRAM